MATIDPGAWVALGDSFTTGVGDDPAAGGWVARVAAALAAQGLVGELVNLAEPGVRIAAVAEGQAPALAGEHAVVSMIAGANDTLAFGFDSARLLDRTRELLALARRHGRLAVTATCPDFFAHRYGPSTRLSWRVDEVNTHVRREAGADVVVLDMHAVMADPALWDPDGVHPNPAGHAALAATALGLVRDRLAAHRATGPELPGPA